tara:strand:+ start:11182 stop:12309 length:1128 start_codon:yes stop_codon:yes gene_type:complete
MLPFEFTNKTILIISPESWGQNFLSKHHYAQELSKKNTVFFLNSIPDVSLTQNIETSKITGNLTVISYKKSIKGLLKLPPLLIDLQFRSVIKEIIKVINAPLDIVWDFDQIRFQNCKPFNASYNIFHPVDIMKQIPSKIKTRKSELSDLTLYLSDEIIKDIASSKPKQFINHGINEYFFHNENHEFSFIKKNKTNIGYIGNIQSKFLDWKVLKTIISKNPGINFVIIGPYEGSNLGGDNKNKDINFLKSQENVALTGSKPIEELINILPNFDAFLICYDTENYRKEVSNSHKLLEYCSTGKVIISNHISTYRDKTNLLEMVNNNIDLPEKFKSVISNLDSYNDKEKSDLRINFAKQNTYKNHLLEIENLITNLHD